MTIYTCFICKADVISPDTNLIKVMCESCRKEEEDQIKILENKLAMFPKQRKPDWVDPIFDDDPKVKESAFNRQVGGNYYKQFKIQPYEFFFVNKITHEKAAIIRRILRYDQPGGKGLQDLQKIQHEIELLIELNDYKNKEAAK